MDRYIRERAKLFRSLADHCHDKVLEATSPHLAVRWIVLMDGLLWCATPEGDVNLLYSLCAAPSTASSDKGGEG